MGTEHARRHVAAIAELGHRRPDAPPDAKAWNARLFELVGDDRARSRGASPLPSRCVVNVDDLFSGMTPSSGPPEYDSLSFKRACEKAARLDCKIVLPKPNELFVDLDTTKAKALFESQLEVLREHFPCSVVYRESRSGAPHLHATVTLGHSLSAAERIALQAALGSDPKRELLSAITAKRGLSPHPTLFFEPLTPPPGHERPAPSVRRDLAIELGAVVLLFLAILAVLGVVR